MNEKQLWHSIQQQSPEFAETLRHDRTEQKIIREILDTFGIKSIRFVAVDKVDVDRNTDDSLRDTGGFNPPFKQRD